MARHLASCGRILRENTALAGLRQTEIREKVQAYFKAQLDQYLDWLDRRGMSKNALEDVRCEMLDHESYLDMEMESDQYLPVKPFLRKSGLTAQDWQASQPMMQRELRKGRRDLLRAVLEAAERLEHYSYDDAPDIAPAPPAPALPASSPLGAAVDDFIAEHSRQWAGKTIGQNRAYLNILVEYFGPDRLLATITKQDASEVKKVLQALPASRNTKPKLKAMPLMQVIKEPGHKKIAAKTINSHIQMFKMFFDWAERHGHSPHTLFEGMKVKKDKASESERKPFTPDQARLIYTELTENPSGLVRKDSHKWGMLLGMFTGARLNEICQLDIADVKQDGDTWFLNITDEGDDTKSVKSKAGRRKVPLHSELIRLGFLDFVESRRNGTRLFPDYSYSANGGYGRNLGRWCNESFLPKLRIKQPGLVFHSLRHTMVTRLGQANVPEPIIQCIVGHARSGVTQEVYLREGYTLAQLKDGIDRFAIEQAN
ncbi:site-specific integrase [Paracoccus spongiarum]|uniref:Site-specific integrase n=1 Tax=Paracoccus spongiarum TaxID=3064387 RepID=A0ABT9J7Z0_9RHOB|nr:site-specific integrase [Paracoccus sp. 2205BS29-5]MDP5305919.1 site-specific integrase [Paracoccus sp. 2205BS29-5]